MLGPTTGKACHSQDEQHAGGESPQAPRRAEIIGLRLAFARAAILELPGGEG
jgi:hypothetical protein